MADVSPGRPGPHRYDLRVYYEDTDAGGVVYHANYLRFAERARTEALRAAGVPHAAMLDEHGVMFMVRRIKLDYLLPARLDDSLLVTTEPMAVRAASADLRQRVWGGDRLLVEIGIQLACVRLSDGRAARLPPRWRMAMAAMVVGEG